MVEVRPKLTSLIVEDLEAVPGPVLEAAGQALAADPEDAQARLDASLAALAAGEPKRALDLVGKGGEGRPLPWPRGQAAITAWARQLDANWYPGGVGAEGQHDLTGMFVEVTDGQPLEMLLEHVVSHGPVALLTPRTLLEMVIRQGNAMGVQQATGDALRKLDSLASFAQSAGYPSIVRWALVGGADIVRRAGLIDDAEQMLAGARAQIGAAGDPVRLALSHLVEGDWHAAPGSSPEALGWDLAPQDLTSPLPPADLRRAATCWDQAAHVLDEAAASGTLPPVPRFRAALWLRRAVVARASGDLPSRRSHLTAARAASHEAGDGAAYHLMAMHLLVADIEEGRLARHALDLGGGWQPPVHGPVAEVLDWQRTVGSTGWTVGLGRLLERCAGEWYARGDAARSRVAYLAALHLISSNPSVPVRQLITQVAAVDSANNLASNALLRLERAFGSVLTPGATDTTGGPGAPRQPDLRESPTDEFAFAQQLEAANVLVGALNAWARGPGAHLAAERLESLVDELRAAQDRTDATLPTSSEPAPRTLDELREQVAAMRGDGSLESSAETSQQAMVLMTRMQLVASQSTLQMIEVLVPLIRAGAADRAGQESEARRWADQAVTLARRAGAEPHLLPLALISDHRLDEARAAVDAVAGQLPDEMELLLRVRVRDHAGAAAIAGGRPEASSWSDLLARAEAFLGLGRSTDARQACEQAIASFEELAARLLRDPERIDACDQPDVAALFTTLALSHLTGEDVTTPDTEASFDAAERARALTEFGVLEGVDPALRQTWQHAAAEYAATAGRILGGLAAASSQQRAASFAALDAADASLAESERDIEVASPGVLARRAMPTDPPRASELRRHLPDGAVLLEYLAVGEDLLAWAMTRETVRSSRHRVRYRDLTASVRAFHSSCAQGRAPESELACWLVEPFADLLREHPRVVVVPFGPLNLVPFHALRLDDSPLALTHVVSYAPSAAHLLREGASLDRAASAARPLVVGDPAFDRAAHPTLQDLPGSRAEAAAVARRLGATQDALLVGEVATEAAVGQRLEECDLLHISSHGHLDELSPFASSLVLAGQDELTVADLTGLRFGTDLAVLTGCDTGRGAATLGGDLVGLTRSLLRSGVARTVVSLWPVDDAVAPVVMDRFYADLAEGTPPALSLAQAQRATYAMDAPSLRAAYQALGGDPDATAHRRRGSWLDPALRDEEEIPEPLGGDAERFWAPFVLVD